MGWGGTYAGNPLACAAALAVLDVIESEDLLARAIALGSRLETHFNRIRLKTNRTHIGEIRRLGAMIGLEFVDDIETRVPATGMVEEIIQKAAKSGLLLAAAGRYDNVIRVLMPLTIPDEVLDEAVSILEAAIEDRGV